MKARVKATNKIIDVYISEYGKFSQDPKAKLEPIYKETEWSKEGYREQNLDFENTINWEQRRYEIAKDILAAYFVDTRTCLQLKEFYVGEIIKIADELIKQLKGD